MVKRDFRYAYCEIVERAALTGFTSNRDLALLIGRGATEKTVERWRKQYPCFDEACDRGLMNTARELSDRMLEFSRDGSESATKFLLERRVPAYMPKQKIDHTSNGNTLAALLAEHGTMSEDEARETGLIVDDDDAGASDWPEDDYFEDEDDEGGY